MFRGSMISNWLSAALARRNIHYGWVMVGVTFFTALGSAGTAGAPGGFIAPLQHEVGRTHPRGNILRAVDPLHPVWPDGAVRRRLAQPLWPAQRDAVGPADRDLGA